MCMSFLYSAGAPRVLDLSIRRQHPMCIRDRLTKKAIDRVGQELGLESDRRIKKFIAHDINAVSYTHFRANETKANLVCRLLLENKK